MEHKNGLEEYYIWKDNRKWRYGYTTSTCAAAAAKAATHMLLSQTEIHVVELMTPKQILLSLSIAEIQMGKAEVRCGVQKDSGDDPDVTNGIMVYAKVSKNTRDTIGIDGGIGVGRVTKAGLEQPVGTAAINKIPRQMITEAVREACEKNGCTGGINVEIQIPQGVEIAKKTFNPNLGIQGGISVLGTSGIVEPMSEAAILESMRIELKMAVVNGARYVLFAPGNYGVDYAKARLKCVHIPIIKCSNYVGDAIDMATECGIRGILFISHMGKLVKVAGGIMNTHSKYGDARMEIITASALAADAPITVLKKLLNCVTTDEAMEILGQAGVREKTVEHMMDKIQYSLNKRAYGQVKIGALMFSNQYGFIGETKNAKELLACLGNYME